MAYPGIVSIFPLVQAFYDRHVYPQHVRGVFNGLAANEVGGQSAKIPGSGPAFRILRIVLGDLIGKSGGSFYVCPVRGNGIVNRRILPLVGNGPLQKSGGTSGTKSYMVRSQTAHVLRSYYFVVAKIELKEDGTPICDY